LILAVPLKHIITVTTGKAVWRPVFGVEVLGKGKKDTENTAPLSYYRWAPEKRRKDLLIFYVYHSRNLFLLLRLCL
jgi:hypothetical protein